MSRHICGCYYFVPTVQERQYLPQVRLNAHTTILSTASRTVLKQKFVNESKDELEEIRYAFPLFDGVSVVDFVCKIGDRTIYGLVKEKAEARKTYEEAKERREKAALLEQLPDAADVFTTSVSNIPKTSSIEVSITYIQELKHDAEVDGVRLTIPTSISPRYGSYPGDLMESPAVDDSDGISLTIDVRMTEGIPVKKIMSPSHPIEVSLGILSTSTSDEDSSISKASATLSLKTAQLDKDFVLQVVAKDVGIPQAILETHPTLPNQRAVMTTLVPKFHLKSQKPEIIFVADRSGSMGGNIPTLISALKVFLKSIPVGCMFNICSFGSNHSFLWPTSQLYSQYTLAEAISHVDKFDANFGGTETLRAVKACFEARLTEMPTELMLLTDGDIWSQQEMFEYINQQTKSGDARVFPIGIGGGVSSALIEGIARAGRGFAQMVANNEKLDSKIVRMLKGALTPHIGDYHLEVKYDDDSTEPVTDGRQVSIQLEDKMGDQTAAKPISLFDTEAVEEHPKSNESTDVFAGLPKIDQPKILQAPYEIPPLFPFNRTCVYLLLSPMAADAKLKSVVLKGTSPQGPLELEIPVEIRSAPDQMIHQLAARKATQELEEGRGWIAEVITARGKPGETIPIRKKYPAKTALLQRREAVRLGVEFQVGGKYCSFVAVEANEAEIAKKRQQALNFCSNRGSDNEADGWDVVDDASDGFEGQYSTHKGMETSFLGGARSCARVARRAMHFGFAATSNSSDQKSVAARAFEAKRAPMTFTSLDSMDRREAPRVLAARGPGDPMGSFSGSLSAGRSLPPGTTSTQRFESIRSGSHPKSGPPGQVVGPDWFSASPMSRHHKAVEPKLQPAKATPKKKKKSNVSTGFGASEKAECEEEAEESDEEMGFGLFDGDTPPASVKAGRDTTQILQSTTSDSGDDVDASRFLKADDSSSESEDEADTVTVDKGTLLENIIAEQSFEGSWTIISMSLRKKMGINSDDYNKALDNLVKAESSLERGKAKTALSTALVVLYLKQKLADEEETWELIVDKANSWLEDNLDDGVREAAWATATGLVRG